MAARGNSMRNLYGGGGRNRGGNNTTDTQGQTNTRGSRFGGPSSPALEALQKAIDAKAPPAEIKAKLAAYRAEMKANEDKLTKAQDDLKQLLTPLQEAIAVSNGLLK